MKKALVFLCIAAAVTVSAWAQIPSESKKYSGLGYSVFDLPGLFNAVPTLSTEARYSAGWFESDVDNYIDPVYHNPGIGTFLFLGGYPAGNNVHDTDYLTPGTSVSNQGATDPSDFFSKGNYAISLGFGKTIADDMYLAAYYGGSLLNAFGQTTKSLSDPDKYDTYAYSIWRNNLAVLFGIAGMGFRFDLVMDNSASDTKTTDDRKLITSNLENGANLSVSWGTSMGQLSPYATLGYKFADRESQNNDGKKASHSNGAILAFIAGAYYSFSEKSTVSAELLLGGQFAESYSGDNSIFGQPAHTKGGDFRIGLAADYEHLFEANKLAFGIKPNFKTGAIAVSQKDSRSGAPDLPTDLYITLSMGFDAGLRLKPNDMFAFYTGVGLRLFEWNSRYKLGGGNAYKTKESEWEFNGIEWNDASLVQGNLGFGMTFSPKEYVSIGFGLNSILDNLVEFNLKNMTVKAGNIWGENKGNFGSWVSGIFQNVKLDLTLSVKIPNGGISAKTAE